MLPRQRIKLSAFVVALISCLSATAVGANAPSAPQLCAVITQFEGRVQILDASRTKVIDPIPGQSISCGSWITVESGWINFKHAQGTKMSLGSFSFAEIKSGAEATDALVLYRGRVHVEQHEGAVDAKIVTANARAQISRGSAIVLFNEAELQSQMIVLENKASFENRYDGSHKIWAKAGEASDLNFKLLRVVPSAPRAMALAALRPILSDLRIEQTDNKVAVKNTLERAERKLATRLVSEIEKPTIEDSAEKILALGASAKAEHSAPSRHIASVGAPKGKTVKKTSYLRHEVTQKDANIHEEMLNRMAGGEAMGEKILYPSHFNGKRQRASVSITDQKSSRRPASVKEQSEKQKLIDELSQIGD